MEIGECSVEDDDNKPSALPLHRSTPSAERLGLTATESGIPMATLTASSSSALLKRCGSSFGNADELDLKRTRLEADSTTVSTGSDTAAHVSALPLVDAHHVNSKFSSDVVQTSSGNRLIVGASTQENLGVLSTSTGSCDRLSDRMQTSGEASQVSDSSSSLSAAQPQNQNESQQPMHTPKAAQYQDLQLKYSSELEYMLREFQKLERQLLGAKTAVGSAETESAASRERREKLHSFIQHLEDTIQQIVTGVELESVGRRIYPNTRSEGDTAQTNITSKEKAAEEAVQKIEEHILANLLPVKVRLKKQLAAQQGAKHNPAGMPAVRGGVILQPDASQQGKATFLSKVEERRTSLYGALQGGGSNLTQKLYGPAAGSSLNPVTVDDKVNSNDASLSKNETKILYAGLALGSSQILSSVSAANAVHKIEIQDPALIQVRSQLHLALTEEAGLSSPTSVDYAELKLSTLTDSDLAIPESGDDETALSDDFDDDEPDHIYSKKGTQLSLAAHAAIMSYEEKRKARKKRRKKKKLLLLQQHEQQQQQVVVATSTTGSKRKKTIKKRGPQSVEYMCALCNEVYDSTCDYNPWWALSQHDCPKCNKFQIPRIDIGSPANAIEYHPALLAHADENGGIVVHAPEAVILPPQPKDTPISTSDAEEILESDLSDDDGLLSDDDSFYCSDSDGENFPIVSAADRAENEKFGLEYDGPVLTDAEASRLISLMLHANTCPCRHISSEHLEVCRSTKYMMLHVRDCPGTTTSFDVCPFPWCRKVKHLLYHLISCSDPNTCSICSNVNRNRNMRGLQGLNCYRGENYQEILSTKNRARVEAEKLKLESRQQEDVSQIVAGMLTSDSDVLENILLDELKSSNTLCDANYPTINSASERNNLVSVNCSHIKENENPPLVANTEKDIDYSINPPLDVSIMVSTKHENDIALMDSEPVHMDVKIEMDVAYTTGIDVEKSAVHKVIAAATAEDDVADTNIATNEATPLPAIKSNITLIHKNDGTATTDDKESCLKTGMQHTSIVKVEPDFVDDNIDASSTTVATEPGTTVEQRENTISNKHTISEPARIATVSEPRAEVKIEQE